MPQDTGNIENEFSGSSADETPRQPTVGRPKGHRNRDKVNLQKRIQHKGRVIFTRLMYWVNQNDDPSASMAAIKLAMAYGWGKPPERILIGNEGGKPFVIAGPEPVQTFEDWQRLVKEAETIANDAAERNASTP